MFASACLAVVTSAGLVRLDSSTQGFTGGADAPRERRDYGAFPDAELLTELMGDLEGVDVPEVLAHFQGPTGAVEHDSTEVPPEGPSAPTGDVVRAEGGADARYAFATTGELDSKRMRTVATPQAVSTAMRRMPLHLLNVIGHHVQAPYVVLRESRWSGVYAQFYDEHDQEVARSSTPHYFSGGHGTILKYEEQDQKLVLETEHAPPGASYAGIYQVQIWQTTVEVRGAVPTNAEAAKRIVGEHLYVVDRHWLRSEERYGH